MEDVLIFLPRNEVIADIVIGSDNDAVVESPTPYRHQTPILDYGASITEGGGKPANAYNALIAR